MDRLGNRRVLPQFVDDVLIQGGVTLATVQPEAMHHLVGVMEQFSLDFDDAYQYVVAEQADSVIVSFDSDLDRTDRKRQTPDEIVREEDGAEA